MADPTMPTASTLDNKDAMRAELSRIEDKVLDAFNQVSLTADRAEGARWLAIGRTHLQLAFMCAKRAIYEGKRVGDP